MRIGHIAPINFNIPNGRPGPTRVFVNLNEELYKLDPALTVFACKNSVASGQLRYVFDQELNNLPAFEQADRMMRGLFLEQHIAYAYTRRQEIDIYLSHHCLWGLPLAKMEASRPTVIIVHNISPDLFEQLKIFNGPQIHFVCLSEAIAGIFRQQAANVSVIHNGIDVQSIKPAEKKSDYFLFLGRLTAPKAPDIAIDICLKKKKKLTIIGKPVLAETEHAAYFHEKVEPYLKNELITYIPELDNTKVFDYYRRARGFIFPMRDYTREGLPVTVPESLACGTPVLALKNPLTEEIIEHGKTGFVAASPDELAEYLNRVDEIDPKNCRAVAEKEFSRAVMAERYYKLLTKIHKNFKS